MRSYHVEAPFRKKMNQLYGNPRKDVPGLAITLREVDLAYTGMNIQ